MHIICIGWERGTHIRVGRSDQASARLVPFVHRQPVAAKEKNEVRNRMLGAGGWGERLHRTSAGRLMGEACHPDKQRSGTMG